MSARGRSYLIRFIENPVPPWGISIARLNWAERMEERGQPRGVTRGDPECPLALEARHEPLPGEEEALHPTHLVHLIAQPTGEPQDVTGVANVAFRSDMNRVNAPVAAEHQRALTGGLEQEEPGPAEETLRALPFCVERDARRAREKSAGAQEDRSPISGTPGLHRSLPSALRVWAGAKLLIDGSLLKRRRVQQGKAGETVPGHQQKNTCR